MRSARSSSNSSSTPITWASPPRVMSSWVGPHPPAANHAVAARQPAAEAHHHASHVVADLHLKSAVDAGQGQLFADPRRIGVDDLTQEQFCADRHNFTIHR